MEPCASSVSSDWSTMSTGKRVAGSSSTPKDLGSQTWRKNQRKVLPPDIIDLVSGVLKCMGRTCAPEVEI